MKKLLVVALVVVGLSAKAQLEVDNNGNVGIGINSSSTPLPKLHVVGSSYFNGNVGVGVTDPTYKLDVDGNVRLITSPAIVNPPITVAAQGIIIGQHVHNPGGWPSISLPTIYGLNNNNFSIGHRCNWASAIFSSKIYYTDIWQYSNVGRTSLCTQNFLEDISKINMYYYKADVLISRDSAIEQIQYVFSAEELQAIFPELVSKIDTCGDNSDSNVLAINYIGMIPILTSAINEQQTLIVAQQEAIDGQESTNQQMQHAIDHLLSEVVQQQTEIEILQSIVLGQELDLTELYGLPNTVSNLQDMFYALQATVHVLQDIILNCCENARQQLTTPPSVPNNNNNKAQSKVQEGAVLYQNTPNPFTSNTEISCDVPVINDKAFIYIYNLQGVELMSFPIVQTGYSIVTVYASALPAGMYLYTLVVDGVIIDTKRMILTK